MKMMICPAETAKCFQYCSHARLHKFTSACEHHACDYDCIPADEDFMPLKEIPGVSFEKEECYLIPISHLEHSQIANAYFFTSRGRIWKP